MYSLKRLHQSTTLVKRRTQAEIHAKENKLTLRDILENPATRGIISYQTDSHVRTACLGIGLESNLKTAEAYAAGKGNSASNQAYERALKNDVDKASNFKESHVFHKRKQEGSMHARIVSWSHRAGEKIR